MLAGLRAYASWSPTRVMRHHIDEQALLHVLPV